MSKILLTKQKQTNINQKSVNYSITEPNQSFLNKEEINLLDEYYSHELFEQIDKYFLSYRGKTVVTKILSELMACSSKEVRTCLQSVKKSLNETKDEIIILSNEKKVLIQENKDLKNKIMITQNEKKKLDESINQLEEKINKIQKHQSKAIISSNNSNSKDFNEVENKNKLIENVKQENVDKKVIKENTKINENINAFNNEVKVEVQEKNVPNNNKVEQEINTTPLFEIKNIDNQEKVNDHNELPLADQEKQILKTIINHLNKINSNNKNLISLFRDPLKNNIFLHKENDGTEKLCIKIDDFIQYMFIEVNYKIKEKEINGFFERYHIERNGKKLDLEKIEKDMMELNSKEENLKENNVNSEVIVSAKSVDNIKSNIFKIRTFKRTS